MNIRIDDPTVEEALKVCYYALRELTENDNIYDDENGTCVSFEDVKELIGE